MVNRLMSLSPGSIGFPSADCQYRCGDCARLTRRDVTIPRVLVTSAAVVDRGVAPAPLRPRANRRRSCESAVLFDKPGQARATPKERTNLHVRFVSGARGNPRRASVHSGEVSARCLSHQDAHRTSSLWFRCVLKREALHDDTLAFCHDTVASCNTNICQT
jgi:hypothetical protein